MLHYFKYDAGFFRLFSFVGLLAILFLFQSAANAAPEDEVTVQKAYIAYYARPADPAGFDYWVGRLIEEGNIEGLIDQFGNSDEYNERFGGLDNATLINNLYQNLFNRDADSAGLNYYTGLLTAGQSTLARISLDILNGAVNDDVTIINNKRAFAESYTSAVRSGGIEYGVDQSANLLAGVGLDVSSITDAISQLGIPEESVSDYKNGPHVVFDANYLSNNPVGSDTNEQGTFRTKCDFSHLNYDDPIMTPTLEGAMHLHSYFGNTAANYQTITPNQLKSESISSTCQGGPLNKTAYWVPALIYPIYQKDSNRDGADRGFVLEGNRPVQVRNAAGEALYGVVRPDNNFETDIEGAINSGIVSNRAPDIYYKFAGFGTLPTETGRRPTNPLPAGLRMIIGNPMRNSDPGVPWWELNYRWGCHETNRDFGTGDQYFTHIPACRLDNSDIAPDVALERVHFNIFFPQCWNGKDLDAADHQSHMANASAHSSWPDVQGLFCPGEETPDPNDDWVRLPVISYNINYPLTWENATPEINPATGEVVRDADGNVILSSSGWFLSSDRYTTYGKMQDANHRTPSATALPGGYSAHADWFMAWDETVVADFVQHCINEERHCANGELGNGYRMVFDDIVTDPALNAALDSGKNTTEVINQGHGNLWP